MFSLPLLKAINDWQSCGTGSQKQAIGKRLREEAIVLPEKFRTANCDCYRRIDLTGKYAMLIGVNTEIKETYSSWTSNIDVAEKFNNGVPLPNSGYQGVIYKLCPAYIELGLFRQS